MKVLKIIHTLGHGGAENTFRWLAWGLRRKGVEVVAAIPRVNSPQEETWLASALASQEVPYITFDTAGSPWQLFKNITAVIDQIRPDVVHSHLLDSNFYSSLASRRRFIPHISTEHGDVSLQQTINTRIKYALISLCSQSIACVSDAVKEKVSRVVPLRRNLKTVYNGIHFMESSESMFRREFGIPQRGFLIGSVGNLYPIKGQKYLIMAFSELLRSCSTDAYLVLVGRGVEHDNLQCLARDLGIPEGRVIFTGFRNDIQNILNSMDLYVQPSLSEGHPIAVLEAMSLGIPVIASAVGGVPEVIGQDKFGTLVVPASWEDLERAMRECLRDHEFFRERARVARDYTRQTFSIEKMAGNYISVYLQALAAHSVVAGNSAEKSDKVL
jgi:glycosyltransferase involved in cell wall biosynthesis